MVWFFERKGEYVRCETRKAADGAYELVVTAPDGPERVERFYDTAEMARRQVEIEHEPDLGRLDRAARPGHVTIRASVTPLPASRLSGTRYRAPPGPRAITIDPARSSPPTPARPSTARR